MDELLSLSIHDLHKKLVDRSVSSLELTDAYLAAIEKNNADLYCYLEVLADEARKDAEHADELLVEEKNPSLLLGIPLALKDNILVEGARCTAASKMLENYQASYDATVVKKLKKVGAVVLGKTNLDEFAMGGSTENSAFGVTKNPHDTSRVPGGTSGGSAAAVAANLCVAALGSDTGGSIRQPAAFCGVAGFKPSYGAVSRHGLIAMASSLDQIGPIAKNVKDARTLFEVLYGHDPLDATSVAIEQSDNRLNPVGLKIGVPKEYFVEGIDPDLEKCVREAIAQLEKNGASVREISLPHTEFALATYYIIMPSEVSANMARYDGIRYGHSVLANDVSVKTLQDVYEKSRREGLGEEVRRRVLVGTYSLSAGYYDAYYLRAQKVRTLIAKDFEKALEDVDVIITPTTPTPAFKIGEKSQDPVAMYLSDIFTVSLNLAGLPGISIPCGTVKRDDKPLPVGLQLIGKRYKDFELLDIAEWCEKVIIF